MGSRGEGHAGTGARPAPPPTPPPSQSPPSRPRSSTTRPPPSSGTKGASETWKTTDRRRGRRRGWLQEGTSRREFAGGNLLEGKVKRKARLPCPPRQLNKSFSN